MQRSKRTIEFTMRAWFKSPDQHYPRQERSFNSSIKDHSPELHCAFLTAHNFSGDERAHIQNGAKEVNCHFLVNEYRDLSCFSLVLN